VFNNVACELLISPRVFILFIVPYEENGEAAQYYQQCLDFSMIVQLLPPPEKIVK
jgi:hypothetical protein